MSTVQQTLENNISRLYEAAKKEIDQRSQRLAAARAESWTDPG